MQPEQRAALLAAKLKALVTDESGAWRRLSSSLTSASFGAGAALTTADEAWLLVAARPKEQLHIDDMPDEAPDPNPHGWLAGAALWSKRRGIITTHVLLDDVTGGDARRARHFEHAPSLWSIVGRGVTLVSPTPFVSLPASEDQLAMFGALITSAGAEVVVDHGILRAEVLGLEVARVVVDDEGVAGLEVGVGKHDRLANAMLGNDRDHLDALRNAVQAVRARRTHGAGHHPANQLARERWLRCVVAANPGIVGLTAEVELPVELLPISGSRPARLKHPSPALLLATNPSGNAAIRSPLIVACTTGVDLDAPLEAADVRAHVAPDARIVIAVPEADAVAALTEVANLISDCDVVTVPNDWAATA